MVAISVLPVSSAWVSANTGGQIPDLGTPLEKMPLTVKNHADQDPGDHILAVQPFDGPDEPVKPHWEPLYSMQPEAGTTDTTVGEWKFNGNGNNEYTGSSATAVDGATFETAGGISNGYAHVPSGTSYVNIAYNALYDLPDTFSIEFWFRQYADQSFLQDLVFKGEGPNSYNFRVFRQLWNEYNNGPVIAGFTSNSSGYWKQVSNPNDLAHKVWHYVAYTKGATSQAYYLDGNRIGFVGDLEEAAKIVASQPIKIGTSAVNTDIDELRISNYAKTASDIGNYYSSFAAVANAGSDQNVCEDKTVTLDGTGSTIPTGTTVTYEWTQTGGTPEVTITDSDKEQATFTAPGVGPGGAALTFQLKITNNAGQESTDTCTVNVADTLVGGTYYVDINSGNDSNNGTSGSPWKTLHHALYMINNGNAGTYVLIMAAGTYSIGNGESDSAVTLSQNNVTIIGTHDLSIGASSISTFIDGTNATTWTTGIEITGSNVTIKDLSITAFSGTGKYGIAISAGTGNEVLSCKIYENNTGVEINNSTNCKIRRCEIYENTTDGLNIISSTGGEICCNTIYKNTHDGVAAFNCSPGIKRNKIYDNNTGIRVEANSNSNTAVSPDIGNNVIYETTAETMNYGILVYGDGGEASPTIYHNSIDGVTGDGIAIEEVLQSPLSSVIEDRIERRTSITTLGPIIKYNIITRCDVHGIDVASNVTCTIDYNDVWHNGPTHAGTKAENYNGCEPGNHDLTDGDGLGKDPKSSAGPLAPDSPCIDAIPTDVGDDAVMDYPGYKRPKGSGYDMGAYEYIPTQTYPYTLPGGTGVVTDYNIFTIPLDIGTGEKMQKTMETALGRNYDPPTHWRVFARTTSGDIEMNTPAFDSLDIKPGMGFWGITILTNTIYFTGTLSPDAIYYNMALAPGWHLFAVPWPGTSINLGKIYVTDGINQYAITDQPDDQRLTQEYIWDYTGTGSTGYTVRSASDFALIAGTGYFIKVLGSSNIILFIPPDNNSDPPYNNSVSTSHDVSYESLKPLSLPNDLEPPPLPDGSYGPVPDIRANGKSGLVTISKGTPVSITVSLDPGNEEVKKGDWWVAAHTPFAPPLDWYSYVYPDGWRPGVHVCVQMAPFLIPPSFEVLNMALPVGDYTIYFAVDDNVDGKVDETWVDSVNVKVE